MLSQPVTIFFTQNSLALLVISYTTKVVEKQEQQFSNIVCKVSEEFATVSKL